MCTLLVKNGKKTRLPSNLRQDYLWMRAFSYACSLPVTWKKDGHTILSAIPENPVLDANITAVCLIVWELLPIEVLHCDNRNFRPIWLLWPWPWPDDLHIRTCLVTVEICCICKYELPMSRLLKVIVWQTCMYIQTWPKLYTTPLYYTLVVVHRKTQSVLSNLALL